MIMALGTVVHALFTIISRATAAQKRSTGMAPQECRFYGFVMAEVVYNHASNIHSLEGAFQGFKYLTAGRRIASLLDVGAGNGNWLRAAQNSGSKIFEPLERPFK